MSTDQFKKTLFTESRTNQEGIYNFTPIEAFTINKELPFGTKLELEDRLFKRNIIFDMRTNSEWGRRLRHRTLQRKLKRKLTRKLKYTGPPNMNPNEVLYKKCLLVFKTVGKHKDIDEFLENEFRDGPNSLFAIGEKIKAKQFNTFYDFKKNMRQLWFYYYMNYEHNKLIISKASRLSQLTEECFVEIEQLSDKEIMEKIKKDEFLNAFYQVCD